MPRAVIEAAASRVPIVTTDVGGVCEVVEHERTGLVCRPGAVAELAACVARLVCNPCLGAQLAAAANVPREFDLAHVVGRHLELYETLR
jgi:glycosyltransferase involved in cell wall biosynthesis